MASEDARSESGSSARGLDQRLVLLSQYLERSECPEAAETVASVAANLRQAWSRPAGGGVRDLYDTLEAVQAGIGSVLDMLETTFGDDIEQGHR